jgi:glycosyltransferase involved in cell wall biosynthesis
VTYTIGFPHSPAGGGPGSFQTRLECTLISRGWSVTYSGKTDTTPSVVCIVGGSKRIGWLRKLRNRGVPIVFRLDGLAWMHRKRWSRPSEWLVNETRNSLTKYIHACLADDVIYQSKFVQEWWGRAGWRRSGKSTVIHNGVDLNEFSGNTVLEAKTPKYLVCIEGGIDYSPFALGLLNFLAVRIKEFGLRLRLYGRFTSPGLRNQLSPEIDYLGPLRRDEVAGVLRNCVYLSLDVLPACPNTVVEALASGVPVIGYDTGAVRELVVGGTGELANYGDDPWKLGSPNFDNLLTALEKVLADYPGYCERARQHAEARLDVRQMTDAYIRVFESAIAEAQR